MASDAPAEPGARPGLDTSVPHIARMYDYWLGGKDNFAVDRAAGDEAMRTYPDMVSSVRANRAFLARAVRYLAGEAGIRQFLDIGTGIPTANNTHEVAQAVAPECRVVYVDNDPIVLNHARALLSSSPEGVTAYIDADLRDTATILGRAARTLDFSQPVAVMLIAVLHMIADDGVAYGKTAELVEAVPSGSFLALSHVASDIEVEQAAATKERLSHFLQVKQAYRTQAEILRFFDGLALVEPGVVPVPQWRPDSEFEANRRSVMRGGVGRKP